MKDYSRLAYITANYNKMLNLRFAPFYLLLILSPWTNLQRAGLAPALTASLLGAAWFILLRRYYQNHFGQVRSTSISDSSTRGPSSLVGVAFLIVALYLPSLRHAHGDVAVLLLSSFLMIQHGIALSGLPIRSRYYIGGAVLTLVPVLSALIPGMPGRGFFQTYDLTLLGGVWMALALLDHVFLLQFFRPIGTHHA